MNFWRMIDKAVHPSPVFRRSVLHLVPRPIVRRWVERYIEDGTYKAEFPTGEVARFTVGDPYSYNWFIPRYADGRLHEPGTTLMLIDLVREARCFVDVGANLGWFTVVAGLHMKAGEVHAFEMEDLSCDLVRRNVALNGLERVNVVLSAVGAEEGEVSYPRRPDETEPNPTRRLSAPKPERRARRRGKELVRVPMISLDRYFQGRETWPDVVKIDVEGADLQVLRGMAQIIAQAKPVLLLEVHPKSLRVFSHSVQDVMSFLEEAGYDVQLIDEFRKPGSATAMRPVADPAALAENSMLLCRPRAG